MIRWIRSTLVALLALYAGASYGQACTTTISAGADIEATVNGMTSGQVLCLNAGTYTAQAGGFNAGVFDITVGVIIRGLGASPSQVVMQSNGVQSNYAVNFVNQQFPTKNANGAQLINLTIQGASGGVQIFDFIGGTRLADIKLKNVVINTTTNAHTHYGFLVQHADRIVNDNVTINSDLTAYLLVDTTDSLIMNSTVPGATVGSAAAVLGGSGNRFIRNNFGLPRLTAGAPYSFNAAGVLFDNTSDNRFESNALQGMQNDALNFTVVDLTPNGLPLVASLNNYAGKNVITHSAFSVNGSIAGSSGIWSNCGSHGTWMYGNDVQGTAEGGLTIFDGKSNMMMANLSHNNGIIGTYISGDVGSLQNCTGVATSFRAKPTNNFVQGNANFYNSSDEVIVRDADNTYLSRNFVSINNGPGGAVLPCSGACQSGFSIESDGTAGRNTSNNTVLAGNIILNPARGVWAESSTTPTSDTVTNIDFYLNRVINTQFNRWLSNTPQSWDRGAFLGGNFWSDFQPTGNPSNGSQPYNKIFHNPANAVGNVVDHFPYQSEHVGRGYSVVFQEPRAGASIALGTRRTVRWDSYGCVWMDILLGGVTLASNVPNTGYSIVTIQGVAAGSQQFALNCKDSGGITRSTVTGNTVNVNSSGLQLVTPGRDDTFNTGQSIWVGWSNPAFLSSVSIDVSTDGGANWSNLTTVAGISSTNPVTSTRLTLPGTGSANAMIRVRSGGNNGVNCGGAAGNSCDETDGIFALRAAAGAIDALTMGAGRLLVMGQSERLKWSSPTSSKLVTVTATVGATTKVLATDLPDRGYFDVMMPDMGVGTMTLTLNFKNIAGGAISTVGPVTAGFTRYPTTITYGDIPSVSPGASATLPAITNSGAGVTLTSNTTGVCTVSGATVTGVSAGTCTITGNAAATGNFAAATPSPISFTVTAAANFARLSNISTRGQVLTGNDVMIAGFIIEGSASKTVVINVAGPSLVPFGITNALMNPTLTLVRSSDQSVLKANDNWQTQTIPGDVAAIQAAGFQPNNSAEPAIIATLPPGAYTAIVQGAGGTTGVGLVGVFEVDHFETPLINISTRGQVFTGNDVMIAGFIISGSSPRRVVINVAGPSLNAFGLPGLPDPRLRIVRSSDQVTLANNDNWQQQTNPSDVALIQYLGFAPNNLLEPAIVLTLPPGAYTAIVDGVGGFTGVGLVGVFDAP